MSRHLNHDVPKHSDGEPQPKKKKKEEKQAPTSSSSANNRGGKKKWCLTGMNIIFSSNRKHVFFPQKKTIISFKPDPDVVLDALQVKFGSAYALQVKLWGLFTLNGSVYTPQVRLWVLSTLFMSILGSVHALQVNL